MEIEDLIKEIKEYVFGEKIVLDSEEFEKSLRNRCAKTGIDYEFEKNKIKEKLPEKRKINQIIKDSEKGLEEGLRLAFDSLIRGNGLATRYLKDSSDKDNIGIEDPVTLNLSKIKNKIEIIRCLCIDLKKDFLKYNNDRRGNLSEFLSKKLNNSMTIEQLQYVLQLPLDSLQDFQEAIYTENNIPDFSKFPRYFEETASRFYHDNAGDKESKYRIYINTPRTAKTYDFLTSYIKMCINKKIPFGMKGDKYPDYNNDHSRTKDNTVLYLREEYIQEYLLILDSLSELYPDIISTFGTPPLLTADLSENNSKAMNKWYGFSDLGQELKGTYNDRTKSCCSYAMICTLCSVMNDKMKKKAMDSGYPIKLLEEMGQFKLEQYEYISLITNKKMLKVRFPFTANNKRCRDYGFNEKTGLLPSVKDDALIPETSTNEFIDNLIDIWNDDISKMISNPEFNQILFEKFKTNYQLLVNYTKFNDGKKEERYSNYTFEQFSQLPTTISMGLWEKGKLELELSKKDSVSLTDKMMCYNEQDKKDDIDEKFENKLNAMLSDDSIRTSEELNHFIEDLINQAFDGMQEQIETMDSKKRLEAFITKIETIKKNSLFQIKTRSKENSEIYGKIAELYRNSNEILQKFQENVKSTDFMYLPGLDNIQQLKYFHDIFLRLGYNSQVLDTTSGKIMIRKDPNFREKVKPKRKLVECLKYDFIEETMDAVSSVSLHELNDATAETKKENNIIKEQNGQEFE